MSRISRKCNEGKYFHIMVQGHNKAFIFKNEKHKERIIKIIGEKTRNLSVAIIAYCIMDNHFHLLIKVEKVEDMAKYMAKVNTSFAKYYNYVHKSIGYVFRDRYRAEPILSINQMINCIKYIHENPVKAKMVSQAEDYKYSSIHDYIKKNISQDIIYEVYGDDVDYLEKISGVYENYDFINEEDEFGEGPKEDFEKVCLEYENYDYANDEIVYKISEVLKKRCGASNVEIYNFMGLKRSTYYNIIKKRKNLQFS